MEILLGFSYSSKSVDFRANLMSFLVFLSPKIYPSEFSRPLLFEIEVIKEKVVFKIPTETHQFAIY